MYSLSLMTAANTHTLGRNSKMCSVQIVRQSIARCFGLNSVALDSDNFSKQSESWELRFLA